MCTMCTCVCAVVFSQASGQVGRVRGERENWALSKEQRERQVEGGAVRGFSVPARGRREGETIISTLRAHTDQDGEEEGIYDP